MADVRKSMDIDHAGMLQEHGALKSTAEKLKKELEEMPVSAFDVISVLDPTPVSDVLETSAAVRRGDYFGAATSAISVFPPAKILKKIEKVREAIAATNKLRKLSNAAREATARAAKAREKILDAQHRVAEKVRENLRKNPPPGTCPEWGTRLPADGKGTWVKDGKHGAKGDSTWKSTAEDGTQFSIDYKKGYPDFQTARLDGKKVTYPHPDGDPNFDARVDILDMKGTRSDFSKADDAMRELLNNPKWKRSKGYVWHHGEDGTSMTLVREEAHNAVTGGGNSVPVHSGGNSMAKHF